MACITPFSVSMSNSMIVDVSSRTILPVLEDIVMTRRFIVFLGKFPSGISIVLYAFSIMWFFAISVATLSLSCSTSVEYTFVFSGSADNSSRNLYIASFVGAKHVYEPYVDKVLKRLLFAFLLMFAFLRMVTKLLKFSGCFSK